jgi:cyclopropane fatty-acyl-phospholipid synthase-like methyltransferase
MKNDVVGVGNENAADDYAADRPQFATIQYLEAYSRLIERGRTILDIGCGDGRPVDEYLVKQGFAVNGIDTSAQLVELAKKNVPDGLYEVKDLSNLKEGEYCVDGVVSLYAIFQTTRERYQEIIRTIASFMPNGGAILLTMGSGEWERSEEAVRATESFWNDYGAEKNTELLESAGFEICLSEIDGSANEKHQIIVATLGEVRHLRRRSDDRRLGAHVHPLQS